MKKTTVVLACVLISLQGSVSQAENTIPVPVVDRTPSGSSNTAVNSTTAPSVVARPMLSAQQSGNAELLMMVDQLQEEVRFLRGQLEEMAHQMKKMRTNQLDRYRDLDRRISGLNRKMSKTSTASPVVRPAVKNSAAIAPVASPSVALLPENSVVPAATVSKAVPVSGMTDRQAYKAAFDMVRQRSFDKALTAFTDFLQIYPGSTLTPNVLYWTGEVYRAQPEPDQQKARDAYARLVELFPKHQKAAEGYYKLGLSFAASGDEAQAKLVMQKVLSTYPNQSSAKLASDYLNKTRNKK
ncbi:MAG: tol-pal system protein YbgF [Motiliproteus sp.]